MNLSNVPLALVAMLLAQAAGQSMRPGALTSRDFVRDSTLRARASQTVMLDPAERDSVVRYQLEKGSYKLCLDENDPLLSEAVLEDSDGRTTVRLNSKSRCAESTLPAGSYSMKTRLAATSDRPVFVSAVPLRTPLVSADGKPAGGWWALRPNPIGDPQRRMGRIRAAFSTVIADYGGRELDEWSLFNFSDLPRVVPDDPEALDVDQNGYLHYTAGPLEPSNFLINDLGGYQFLFGMSEPTSYFAPDPEQNNRLLASPAAKLEGRIEVVFRFFPDGTQMEPLNEGEAALFRDCNYQGQAIVITGSIPNVVALSSGFTALDGGITSIKLGNNTSVIFYINESYIGTQQPILEDTPCITSQHPASILVRPLQTTLFLSSKSCVGCKLAGANLSGRDLSGFDLSQADLTGANLTRTVLRNVKATHTWFDRATLNCTDFSGTVTSPVDLRQASLVGMQINDDASCQSNFQWTELTTDAVPARLWRSVDLRNARFSGLAGQVLSSKENPLDLTGAMLAGASLEDAILDYATGLVNADLTAIDLNHASLQFVDMSGAKLYSARLTNTNLQSAKMAGAFLSGNPPEHPEAANLTSAYLKDADLSKATLNGANFANASFYNNATAAGATMNNTQFSNAYLAFADFSGATVQGVQFGNAVLIGANFNGAMLSPDPQATTSSGFSAALLQGTDLSDASLTETSLANAFVDFTPGGNSIVMVLDESHTTFPGWQKPGEPVCVLVIYPKASAIKDNSTLTCPDGSSGPCGAQNPNGSNTQWKSLIDISAKASYLADSTYTKAAASPVCTDINVAW